MQTHINILSANEVPPKCLRAVLHNLVEALLRECQQSALDSPNSEVQRDGTANSWYNREKHDTICSYPGANFRARKVAIDWERTHGASEKGAYRPNLEVAPRMKVDLVPC